MKSIALILYENGLILRSGGAPGADAAFESGVPHFMGKEIYIPWKNFEQRTEIDQIDNDIVCGGSREAASIAERFTPGWHSLQIGGKKLHTRNVFQVLGRDLNTPSKFLICWTSGAREIGGTRTALVLAREYKIPIYNLGDSSFGDYKDSFLIGKILTEAKKTEDKEE